MIETPSSLFELDEILEQSDFISIGTNDLSQFMLAADRNTLGLITGNSTLYPIFRYDPEETVRLARARRRAFPFLPRRAEAGGKDSPSTQVPSTRLVVGMVGIPR